MIVATISLPQTGKRHEKTFDTMDDFCRFTKRNTVIVHHVRDTDKFDDQLQPTR